MDTYSHIARPEDSRCRWWQRGYPEGIAALAHLDLAALEGAASLPGACLRRGADLELPLGAVLLGAEAVHPTKQRGWRHAVGCVLRGADGQPALRWRQVEISGDKSEMKAAGCDPALLAGSGPVAAAVRLLRWRCRPGGPWGLAAAPLA